MVRNPGGGEASEPRNNSASSPRSKNDHDGGPKEGVEPVPGEKAEKLTEFRTVNYPNGDVYEGELKDGKKYGRGVCRYAIGAVYDGEWKDGDQHGTGVFTSAKGNVYEGEWVEGKRHGQGMLTSVDGAVYDGEWKDDVMHGRGTRTAVNGSVYEGEFKEGKKHGRGVYTWASGSVYDGEWRDNDKHGTGTITLTSGEVYEGEFKDGLAHGTGTTTFSSGDVYVGEWVEGMQHGSGTYTWRDGEIYEEGKKHGKGTLYSSGDIYEGNWANGQATHGKMTLANGTVYEGGFVDEMKNGRGAMRWPSGNLYEGEWKDDKQHGRGTVKWKNGDVYEGEWAGGQKTRGTMTWAGGETWTGCFSHNGNGTGTLDPPCEPPIERKLRSQRSQQRRLQKDATARKMCEHCGVNDVRYKLRACSGCGLALYCSAACQKVASGSHRRICNIIAQLPSRDAERLLLECDEDKMVDFDAGLRYAKKYMDNMKHLAINLEEMGKGDKSAKLSAKQLTSLLRSKKGALDSVSWRSGGNLVAGISINGYKVWKELHGLKQLWLQYMEFDGVQLIHDIIHQQRGTLLVLGLPFLDIEWQKAKCRRAFAQAVHSCTNLVKLNLGQCSLTDTDLKVMLQDLPNLRILNLSRHPDDSHGFSDKTCSLIARKCPGLQELNLDNHNQLSVRGIRKIFEGCAHLRSFYATTRKLTCKDVQSLLDIAPRLLYFSPGDKTISDDELSNIIEATGGRVVFQPSMDSLFEPDGVSARTREKYECQKGVLRDNVWKRRRDPEVANEWAGMLEG